MLSLCILLGSVAGRSCVAQSQADQDLMTMNLEDLAHVKVFTASRHLEESRKAPSSVSIITADDIRRYGWRTLADALRSLRGFYTSYDRQYSYLGVRGVLRPGDWNSRILLLQNGHRLNENVYDSAFFGTEFPLDLDLIDHIEVVRGPGSSLYGTDAMFGVINVITRQAGSGRVLEASADTSSFLGRSGHLAVADSRGKLAGLLAAGAYKNPGPSPLFFPKFASPLTNNGYAVNMDGDRYDHAFADLQYGAFRLQSEISDRLKTSPTASYGVIFNDSTTWLQDTRGFVDASVRGTMASGTDYEVRVYYDAYNYVGSGAFAVPSGQIRAYSKARADWAGAQAGVSQQVGAQRFTLGIDVEQNIDILQRDFYQGQPDCFHSSQEPSQGGLYGEAELHWTPKVVFHAGERIDAYSTFGVAQSPRIAAIYLPTPQTALKYIFSEAFRAPNAYEEFYFDDIAIAAPPRTLKPETVVSHEGIVEDTPKPWLSVTADGFYNQIRNQIDQVPDGGNGLTYFINDARVRSRGIEFEIDAEHKSGPALRASYAIANTLNQVTNTSLSNAPVGEAKLNGVLPVFFHSFVAVEMVHVNALTDYQGTRVPPYLLPSATFTSRTFAGGWQFSASAYNAADHAWFSPMGPNDPEDQIQMDGRTWRFRLSYRSRAEGK